MKERPIECIQCNRKADVHYTEIVGELVMTTEMCRDCPILKSRLQGKEHPQESPKERSCQKCQTSLDAILLGEPPGCAECYLIFKTEIASQFETSSLLSSHLEKMDRSLLHLGASPDQSKSDTLLSRLHNLKGALSAALERENYEEAAWLRDQIKTVEDQLHGG